MIAALVLAAGLGERLRPLTDAIPKPLAPVIARPLIEQAFLNLHRAGISDIAVNAHHLPDRIEDYLRDGTVFGQRVTISRETPRILGTGGAIKRLREFLSATDVFVVCNGDTLSRPDLAAIIETHRASGTIATMALRRDERAARYGAVQVGPDGAVTDIGGRIGRAGADAGLFIGTHVISNRIFDFMPDEESFCINADVYVPLIRKTPGLVRAVFTDEPFFDLGTPADYARAQFAILETRPCPFPHFLSGLVEREPGVFVSPSAHVDPYAVLTPPCAVCTRAEVLSGAEIGPMAVIGEGARIGAGAAVRQFVVLPDAALPEKQRLSCVIAGQHGLLRFTSN